LGRDARPEGQDMRRLLAAVAIAAAPLLTVVPSSAAPPGQAGGFNLRFGGFFPSGHSDFWDWNESEFTLDHSDFNGPTGGIGYTASINNYFEVDVNSDFYFGSTRSADRFITDTNGLTILHDSRLGIFPVTVGFRVLPAGRYTRRGAEGKHYVRRPVPYFGAGIGMEYWQYEEEGDFAFPDPGSPTGFSIFYDRRQDSGVEFEKHAMLGIEIPVSPEWNLTFEVRQSWAEATLNEAFPSLIFSVQNPHNLDLGGTSVFFGGSLRF
jgi:outer membrane protein with beta-barrel domain